MKHDFKIGDTVCITGETVQKGRIYIRKFGRIVDFTGDYYLWVSIPDVPDCIQVHINNVQHIKPPKPITIGYEKSIAKMKNDLIDYADRCILENSFDDKFIKIGY